MEIDTIKSKGVKLPQENLFIWITFPNILIKQNVFFQMMKVKIGKKFLKMNSIGLKKFSK